MRRGHSCCIWSLASRPLQMQRQQPPAAPCVTARWHAPSLSPALVLQAVTRLQNSRALPPRHTHARQSSCPACSADLQLRATPTDAYMLAQRPASLTSQSSEPITAIDPPSIGHYTFYMAAHLPAGPQQLPRVVHKGGGGAEGHAPRLAIPGFKPAAPVQHPCTAPSALGTLENTWACT